MNKNNISPAEYLKKRIKVWCHNRGEWEIDELTILPKGDFIDRKNRLHRKENHTAFVTLDDALAAIEMTHEALLAETEAKIDALKSENMLLESLKILSEHQEKLARDYTPDNPKITYDEIIKRIKTSFREDIEKLWEHQTDCFIKACNGEIGMGPLWNLDNKTNEESKPEFDKDANL
jgi:hypothetical protein